MLNRCQKTFHSALQHLSSFIKFCLLASDINMEIDEFWVPNSEAYADNAWKGILLCKTVHFVRLSVGKCIPCNSSHSTRSPKLAVCTGEVSSSPAVLLRLRRMPQDMPHIVLWYTIYLLIEWLRFLRRINKLTPKGSGAQPIPCSVPYETQTK
jgi:hypothetical protein